MPWLEVVGWLGSGLVVLSLTLSNLRRFRVLNLVGSLIATAYNAVLGVWPFVAMNAAIAVINLYWLVRLHRERFVERAYRVARAQLDDDIVRHLLEVHRTEIARYYPRFEAADPDLAGAGVLLVLLRDEVVGLLVTRPLGPGVARVEVDFVTARFRDYTPGQFVYAGADGRTALAADRVVVATADVTDPDYFRRLGFVEGPAGQLVLDRV